MLIRALDVETSGFGPEAEICEIGFCDVARVESATQAERVGLVQEGGACLVRISRPMPPEAQAVHHISDDDLRKYGVEFPYAWAYMLKPEYASDGTGRTHTAPSHPDVAIYAAHNAAFEQRFISTIWTGTAPWICTQKCAMRAWPDLPAFGLQVIRYALPIRDVNAERANPPHAAAPDAYISALVLAELLELYPIEMLVKWSAEHAHWPRVNFGSHEGKRWHEVPADYLTWILKQPCADDDIKWRDIQACARHETEKRRGKR